MTPDERTLVLALATTCIRPPMPRDVFLKRFGATDGAKLGLDLLGDAVGRRQSEDVELALIVCFVFGLSDAHLGLLHVLAFADWHISHEDVASALGDLKSPSSVEALLHLAVWVPDYLDYDEFRALATKAIWALGSIDDDSARAALKLLSSDHNVIVARGAHEQLEMQSRDTDDPLE